MPVFNPRSRANHPAGSITIALYRIGQAMSHILRQRAELEQLSPTQIDALLFLKFARRGVHTIGGLAQRLASTYATASGVTDALERKQLVQRESAPDDARKVVLALTEQGQQRAGNLEDLLNEVEAAVTELPEVEQQALLRATQAIIRRLQAAGHVQVYEMCWGCQFFRRNAHPADPAGPHHCAFVNAPLAEPNTYSECPDFVSVEEMTV